jgi:hypothetical protein
VSRAISRLRLDSAEALTSALALPDITTTRTIRLRRTSVVFSPRQVPHCPPDHLTALKAHRLSPEHPTEKEDDGDEGGQARIINAYGTTSSLLI